MAKAAFHSAVGAEGSRVVADKVRSGGYSYRLSVENSDPKLIISTSTQSIAADVTWTFGAGVRGQTYILENKGTLFDSQVSSFRGLHGMGITPGHEMVNIGGDLHKALGTPLTEESGARCFGCHTTASTTKDQFNPKQAVPGVSCEACHGPGLAHAVAATMDLVEDAKALIFDPSSLRPLQLIDFCGACHMTAADVLESNLIRPNDVRFQPYRLEKSRCWGIQGDPRLSCVACHNPHQPLVHEASSYDQRCLACHSPEPSKPSSVSEPPHVVCPKASANCTTCHMPKYNVPEMHGEFTDHFIRVVRKGEPYPN
jgi:Cytochrome c554 and c-prime